MLQKKLWLTMALLVLLTLIAGCNAEPLTKPSSSQGPSIANPASPTPEATTIPVKVYFALNSSQMLAPELHSLPNDSMVMVRALEILAAGPKTADLLPVVSSEVKIRSVTVQDRLATADFSQELVTKAFGGSYEEILTVAAIVNTLTEFPHIDKVQILVEGKKVTTLSGHMDVSEPLERSSDIIKK